MIINTSCAEHYIWGDNCDGWHLVKTDGLSVIQEQMPPGTEEACHYHEHAQQLFCILNGTATFLVDGDEYEVAKGNNIHIEAGKPHKIINRTNSNIEFLVISQPKSHGDRVLVDM